MTESGRQASKTAAVVGGVAGVTVAALMMYIAWQHNAQGEIHDETGVHWLYWLGIGISWLVPVGTTVGLGVGALMFIARRKNVPNKPLEPTPKDGAAQRRR